MSSIKYCVLLITCLLYQLRGVNLNSLLYSMLLFYLYTLKELPSHNCSLHRLPLITVCYITPSSKRFVTSPTPQNGSLHRLPLKTVRYNAPLKTVRYIASPSKRFVTSPPPQNGLLHHPLLKMVRYNANMQETAILVKNAFHVRAAHIVNFCFLNFKLITDATFNRTMLERYNAFGPETQKILLHNFVDLCAIK